MSPALAGSELGVAVAAAVRESDLGHVLLDAAELALPLSVEWRRGTHLPRSGQARKKSTSATHSSSSYSVGETRFERAARELFCCRVFTGREFADALDRARTPAAAVRLVRDMQARLPAGTTLILLVLGLDAAVTDALRRRGGGGAGGGGAGAGYGGGGYGGYGGSSSSSSSSSGGGGGGGGDCLVNLESFLTTLWVETDVQVKSVLTAADAGEYVARLTREIAERPYALMPTTLACVVKVKVPKVPDAEGGGGAGGGSKKTASATFRAMLQSISGVSDAKAAGVVRAFPTFRALMDAYRDRERSAAEKAVLLEGPAAGEGKRGKATAISRRIYNLMSLTDPDAMV
jgi:hypothetical protein